MGLEPSAISGFLIAGTTLLLFLYSQASSRAQSTRKRVRKLERRDDLRARYIYRLEQGYATLDRQLPDKPEGYDIAMEDDEI